MARMPGAEWRPLPRPSKTDMARYDLVCIHTCVGSFEGTDGYFRRLTNGVNSHFLTGGYGELRQLVDTAVRSGANGDGNHRAVTVENADMGAGFAAWDTRSADNVPAFTPQQVEINARICAWAHLEHGVPLVAADTSRPSVRGVGFHRLGCDPYRVWDGERWSKSYGKGCPGPRRIAQIPQIITRARQIVADATEEDDMPSADEVAKAILNTPTNLNLAGGGRFPNDVQRATVQQLLEATAFELTSGKDRFRRGGGVRQLLEAAAQGVALSERDVRRIAAAVDDVIDDDTPPAA